ncbi:MAG: hypothetical protein ED557_09345 [Balneola sp.]|nr:MAG: hypothetical protein ED557_09345 [Balneola sp.]
MVKRSKLLLLFFLLSPLLGYSQSNFKFSSTFLVQQESDFNRLNPIVESFDQKMISKGAEKSENEGLVFLIGASDVDLEGNIVLSITVFSRLPENIIQSGKMGQAFYLAVDTEPLQRLTEGGARIREELSEDYLRQFMMVLENEIILTNTKTLDKDLDKYILRYQKRRITK